MEERMNLHAWIGSFIIGDFDDNDVRVQIKAGWYDWFCRDTSLATKTKRMGKIITQLREGGKVDFKNLYVWFKNNCPLNGPLYDDFRFASLEDGEVQFTIQLDCCWNEKKYTVWGRRCHGAEFQNDKPLFETDSVRELVKWFNTPWEDLNMIKIGDKIHITRMNNEPRYKDREGEVTYVDDKGQIHGTWGGCALVPGVDEFEKI